MECERDVHLICRQCSTRLTADLQLVPFDTRNDAMGEALLAVGSLMQEDGSYFQEQVRSFLANINDTQHMKLTSDPHRLNGCCGLDGCDGANLQCEACGTYVATKHTDCWTPHYVAFDPSTTEPSMEDGR